MLQVYDAHPATVIAIVAALMVTPFYVLATYVFSGASARKGLAIGAAFLAWGAAMTWACLADVVGLLGMPGNLVVPAAWLAPTLILLLARDWFLDQPLSQHWLVGLQLFRAVGGTFLIEMTRGHVPAVFAWPAGVGDLLVAAVAGAILVACRQRREIPAALLLGLIALGVADFASAFFFGFTSSESPFQLFFPERPSRLIEFPTGMIPLFLVPYAIFFHGLSWLTLRRRRAA